MDKRNFDFEQRPAPVAPRPSDKPAEPQFTFDWKQSVFEETGDSIKFETPDFSASVINDPEEDRREQERAKENNDLTPISDDDLGKELFAGLDLSAIPATTEEPMGYGTLTRTSAREFSTDWDKTETASPLTPTSSGVMPAVSAKAVSHWRNLWRLSSPILGYAAVLCGVCILSYSNPKLIAGFAESIAPHQATAAPAEVYIKDTAIKQINLDSGEAVSVVSGKLVNESNRNFSEVVLEGILFDNNGAIVAKRRINAGSSLGKSRIQALSVQMIDDLQESKPAKRFELRAGQEYEFTMAIPQESQAGEQIRPEFFNSRIYSVKPL